MNNDSAMSNAGEMTEMRSCARACHECQDACLGLVVHCLQRGGEHAASGHINLLLDCVAICDASHDLLHRGSEQHHATCRACAEICEACAQDCERLGKDDEAMIRCAEACRRCAEECRKMS